MAECVIDGKKIDRKGLLQLKIETGNTNSLQHLVLDGIAPLGRQDVINNEIQKLPLDPAKACDDLKAIRSVAAHYNAPKM